MANKDKPFTATDEILATIRQGNEQPLKEMYRIYRGEFFKWASQYYNVNEAEMADVFQDAMIIFYRNIVQGKITTLDSSVKTYLFGIGKNLLMNAHKKNKRIVSQEIDDQVVKNLDFRIFHEMETTSQQQLIADALRKLGENCREIIQLFYFRRFSHEAIATHFQYKSEGVSRTTLRRCLIQLTQFLDKEMFE